MHAKRAMQKKSMIILSKNNEDKNDALQKSLRLWCMCLILTFHSDVGYGHLMIICDMIVCSKTLYWKFNL